MKFSCTKLQLPPEPLTRGLLPPYPLSLFPLSSTEFVEPPPRKKIPRYAIAPVHMVTYQLDNVRDRLGLDVL
jgi:hypothetical protein